MVNIVLSLDEAGELIDVPFELKTDEQVQIWYRHDGLQLIDNLYMFVNPCSSNRYDGVSNPMDDYNDIVAGSLGQLQINLNYEDGFPGGSWVTIQEGEGDTLGNSFNLGTLEPEETERSFLVKWTQQPSLDSQTPSGKRLFDIRFSYQYSV